MASYLHIRNLYQAKDVLYFKEVYALEKVHGTSAHVSYHDGDIHFYEGGESRFNFLKLFDIPFLTEKLAAIGKDISVHGEAYGGSQQRMSNTYGKVLKFIVFDIKISDYWLSVPDAAALAESLGLEFVPYRRIPAQPAALDAERDRPSEVAVRNGCGDDKQREGIVIRPPVEFWRDPHGEHRLIAKHKGESFNERLKVPHVEQDPERLKVLSDAEEIAKEWVVPMRLEHVLDKMGNPRDMAEVPKVIAAMWEDVFREAEGEVVDSKEARKAIGKATAILFKRFCEENLYELQEVAA